MNTVKLSMTPAMGFLEVGPAMAILEVLRGLTMEDYTIAHGLKELGLVKQRKITEQKPPADCLMQATYGDECVWVQYDNVADEGYIALNGYIWDEPYDNTK